MSRTSSWRRHRQGLSTAQSAALLASCLVSGLALASPASDFVQAFEAGDRKKASAAQARLAGTDGRCARAILVARRSPPLAHAGLLGCTDASVEMQRLIRRTRREVLKVLRAGNYAPVSVTLEHGGEATVTVSTLPLVPITAPAELWLPEGTHTVIARRGDRSYDETIEIDDRARRTVILKLPAPAEGAREDGETELDFTAETAKEAPEVGDLEKPKYGSLLPEKYAKRRRVKPSRPQVLEPSPWALGATAALGFSSFAEGESALAYQVAAQAIFRPLGARLIRVDGGLGVLGKGGELDGDSELVHGAAARLRGGIELGADRYSGWGVAGLALAIPLSGDVAGRELDAAEPLAVFELGSGFRVGGRFRLELTVQVLVGLTEPGPELGRSRAFLFGIGGRR